jgi:hypothetical protein
MTIEKSGLCWLCDDGEREKGEIKTRIYSGLAYWNMQHSLRGNIP